MSINNHRDCLLCGHAEDEKLVDPEIAADNTAVGNGAATSTAQKETVSPTTMSMFESSSVLAATIKQDEGGASSDDENAGEWGD
jgi:hypothetical protein